MRVAFYASRGKKFDETIARHFRRGCRRLGDECEILATADWHGQVEATADLGVVVGVKNVSGPIFRAYRDAGKHAVFIDKGYTRIRGGPLGTLYWRFSVDEFQPLAYFQRQPRAPERWLALKTPLRPRQRGRKILYAGSSQKFCDWHCLGDATLYAERVLEGVRKHTQREIIYRPKPSWKNAVPVEGYGYSGAENKFIADLMESYCLVTYGSNACFEALLHGVPTVVLGDGVTRPVSDTTVRAVDAPRMPSLDEIRQLAFDLAYCQVALTEMADGLCWRLIREVTG